MTSSGSRHGKASHPRSASHRPRAGERLAHLDELEVTVEKLVMGGEGLARFEGIPIFVPRSAPGDRLRVRLVERRPDFGRAEIVDILEPAAGRRKPPCPHFARCGGCDLQHLDDALQVKLKTEFVRETLLRLGGLSAKIPIEVVAGQPWGYRLRTQLHTSQDQETSKIGYRARRSHSVVEVDCCPVLVEELESLLPSLARALPSDPPRRLDLVVGDDGSLSSAPVTHRLPQGGVMVSVGEFEYEIDARCFFQAHRQLLPVLVERVVGDWTGQAACDLYAGVGLFSLPLARRYSSVVAVEADKIAARFARRNAARHRLREIQVVSSAVESWISKLPHRVDRVVLDPPRGGLSRRVRSHLIERRPQRLTYLSCNPGTLARDLKQLIEVYDLEKVTLLDMFPQTGHAEVVVQLARR